MQTIATVQVPENWFREFPWRIEEARRLGYEVLGSADAGPADVEIFDELDFADFLDGYHPVGELEPED